LAKNLPSIADGPQGKSAVSDAYKFQALYCNNPPPDTPYSPGKCPIRYAVKVPVLVTGSPEGSQNTTYPFEFYRWGPIGTATIVKTVDGSPNGTSVYQIKLTSHGDAFGTRSPNPITEVVADGFGVKEPGVAVVTGTTSSKLNSGDSDTCPDEEPPDYDPTNFTFPITINNTYNDGNTINIPVVAIVGQFFVDANLNLNMPVKLSFSPSFKYAPSFPVTINANLNLNTGGVSYDITNNSQDTTIIRNPNYYSPDNTSDPDTNLPTYPPGLPPTPTDNDPAASKRIIRAAIVTVTATDGTEAAGTIFQGENPDVRYPSLGVISFLIDAGGGKFGWTVDLPVKNERSFIPVDWELGAVAVKGTPKQGVTWTITPVYLNQKVELAT
jgi:hypothetical protein